jgi:hypothetical protein
MYFMEWRNPKYACNIVRDWDKLQGFTSPTDSHIQIKRDINSRLVTIENSSERDVGIAITTFYGDYSPDKTPKLQFILKGGEVKSIGINSIGSPMQYIHILDPQNGKRIGQCTSFRTDSNQFVLRDGLNGWFVQFFQRTAFRPSK